MGHRFRRRPGSRSRYFRVRVPLGRKRHCQRDHDLLQQQRHRYHRQRRVLLPDGLVGVVRDGDAGQGRLRNKPVLQIVCRSDVTHYRCRFCRCQSHLRGCRRHRDGRRYILGRCLHRSAGGPHQHVGWGRSVGGGRDIQTGCLQNRHLPVEAGRGAVRRVCRNGNRPFSKGLERSPNGSQR